MWNKPVIDSHLHLLNPQLLNYPWGEIYPLMHKLFILQDYNKACRDIKIEKMVFVEVSRNPLQYLEEVEWVTSLAEHDPRIKGIVAWAPLENGEKVCNELNKLLKNLLVKGIRRIIQYEEDIEFCLRPDFIKGVQTLADYDFSFDICVSHLQLKNTVKLINQCPEVKFVLEHIGKPDIKNQVFDPWRKWIRELSDIPGLYCKVSGMVTEADLKYWKEDDLKPYLYHILECFGFDRVMYGGDWPMVLEASDYRNWFTTISNLVEEFSDEELNKLFYKNAQEFYSL
ncbi:amidohydrolase family protein [Actinomycetota bacterium]